MSLDELVKGKRRAVVIGIGGGGDVVSTLPVARRLKSMGIDSIVGGVAWQWAWTIDPKPGPRSLSEVKNCERLSETIALVTPETAVPGSTSAYPEVILSKLYYMKVMLVDITKGPPGVVLGLTKASKILDFDLLVGVDAGGDVLQTGKEPLIRSPEADAIMLSAMSMSEITSLLSIVGLGLDGELTLEELRRNIAKCSEHGGYFGVYELGPEDFQEYEKCLQSGVRTNVGRFILKAANGYVGRVSLRSDITYYAEISPLALKMLFFDPKIVFRYVNEVSRKIVNIDNFEEINRAIAQSGIRTMYNRERRFALGRRC